MNLFLINEIYTNGYKIDILDLLSLLSILSGALVIISKNPIVSILFLIGLFLSISSYLILLGLSFIGLSYLIIYVGAISILFLFILMLINIRISELHSNSNNSAVLAIFLVIFLNYILFQLLPYDIAILNNFTSKLNNIIYYIKLNKNLGLNNIFDENKYINIRENSLSFATSND
jgi:NADH-ubiquinone oxidoreductase chain 6